MLKQLLEQAVLLTPANEWPTYDGKVLDRSDFLTSSEATSCLRQTFFSKRATGGSWRANGYAERGHAVEAWLVDKLLHLEMMDYRFHYVGKAQRSFYDPELGLSGTPDGVMETPQGKFFLLEFKSIDPRTNKHNLPKGKHTFQVQQNMYLVQKCTDIKLDGAILFYVDASNVFDTNEFAISYDEAAVKTCADRAKQLWEATNPDDLEPEGLYNGDCETCPYTGPCSATIDMQKALAASGSAAGNFSASELPSEGEALLSDEETEALRTFLYARKEAKEFEDVRELWKPDVQKLVTKRNGLVVLDGAVVTATTQPGRETLDRAKLEEDGINIERYLKVGKPYIVLNVKG